MRNWKQQALGGASALGAVLLALSGTAAAQGAAQSAAPAVPGTASPLVPAVTLPVQVGQAAADFALPDTDGQTHRLSEYLAEGKTVVLEWFSPACSACVAYYTPPADGTPSAMEQIIASVAGDDVVWLAVNSSGADKPGGGVEANAKARTDWHMTAPVLLDASGAVGKAYGAKRTPTVYIITPDGKLRYKGSPDDPDVTPELPGINYALRAITQIRLKQPVTIFETMPFG
jgi:peroxiredoxin